LSDVKFDLKDGQGLIEVDKVKIVAADVDGEDLVLQLLLLFFFFHFFIYYFFLLQLLPQQMVLDK